MMQRNLILIGGLVAGLALVTGCANDTSQAAASATAKTEYNVAVIRWDPNDVFFNGVQAGEEEEFKRLEAEHGVKINVTAFGANDAAKQTEALRAQMAKGVDGVSLVSWRGESMKSLMEELKTENVPVVTHNSYVPDVEQTYVSFDGVKAGEMAAQAVVDTLDAKRGKSWRDGDGVFVELRCLITLSTDVDRHNGMHTVIDPIMAANSKLKIVEQEAECDGEKARAIVDDSVSKYGADKILGIMTIDGTAAVGGALPALKAAQALYPNDDPRYIPVASVDCSKPELDSIEAGELTSCSEQPAKAEGIVSARLLFDMMSNGSLTPTLTPDTLQAELAKAYGDQPWMPIKSLEVNGFTGQWFGIQSFGVPADLAVGEPGHWAE